MRPVVFAAALCMGSALHADRLPYPHTLVVKSFSQDTSRAVRLHRRLLGARILGVQATKQGVFLHTSMGWAKVNGEEASPVSAKEVRPPAETVPPVLQGMKGVSQWVQTTSGEVWAVAGGTLLHAANGSVPRTISNLPHETATCVALQGSVVWVGTEAGAAALKDGAWRWYSGRRWLPDGPVVGIAAKDRDTVIVATSTGAAALEFSDLLLRTKEEHYDRIQRTRHLRDGFAAAAFLKTPGDLKTAVPLVSERDSLRTACMVAAQSLRHAFTMDTATRSIAQKGMDALLQLFEVTGTRTFPARAMVREGETAAPLELGSEQWSRRSPSNPKIRWMNGTGIEEIAAHYLAWSVYSRHCMDGRDRGRILPACRRLTDHILDNGGVLIGEDGKPTPNGRWLDERGEPLSPLHALLILSHVKAAAELTGGAKYREAYRSLAVRRGFAAQAAALRVDFKGSEGNRTAMLAWAAWYPLLSTERDPALRSQYLQALDQFYSAYQHLGIPLWNFTYGALTGKPCSAELAVPRLMETPMDLVTWTVRNSTRRDLDVRGGRLSAPISTREMPLGPVYSDPLLADGGDGGLTEEDPTFWQLPYWLGKYHGIIQ